MRSTRFLAFVLLFLTLLVPTTRADDPPAKPAAISTPKAKQAIAERDAAAKKAEDELATKTREARVAFSNKLEAAEKVETQKSNSDEAARLDATKRCVESDLDCHDEAVLLTQLSGKDAFAAFEAATKKARDDFSKKMVDAQKVCAKKLDSALKEVMKKGDLAEATLIDKEKKASEEEASSVDVERDGHWIVLFRSSDPAIWNTDSKKGDTYSAALSKAPRLTSFVRVRRMDTRDFVVLAITKPQLTQRATDGDFCWEGSLPFAQGGRHLGIDRSDWHCTVQDGGRIMVTNERGNRGWGFGHKVHVNDKQYWSWAGEEIPETVFEIAVKADKLTRSENEKVLGKKP